MCNVSRFTAKENLCRKHDFNKTCSNIKTTTTTTTASKILTPMQFHSTNTLHLVFGIFLLSADSCFTKLYAANTKGLTSFANHRAPSTSFFHPRPQHFILQNQHTRSPKDPTQSRTELCQWWSCLPASSHRLGY